MGKINNMNKIPNKQDLIIRTKKQTKLKQAEKKQFQLLINNILAQADYGYSSYKFEFHDYGKIPPTSLLKILKSFEDKGFKVVYTQSLGLSKVDSAEIIWEK